MAVLVLPTSPFVERQLAALRSAAPDERIHTDPATAPRDDIEAILAFRPTRVRVVPPLPGGAVEEC